MTVSRDDLRRHLGAHWNIRSIELTDYATAFTHQMLERMGGAPFEQAGVTIDPAKTRTDEHGRILAHVWHLQAQRR